MKMLTFVVAVCAALGSPVARVAAQAPAVPTVQWQVHDQTFTASETRDAPFEVRFDANFTGPGGQTLTVPGFYNGGRDWVLRFSAPSPGRWTYHTHSDLPGLDGLSGAFEAAPNPDPHGPLVIHPDNPRRFARADGTPCNVLAFECDWLFALDYDNPRAAPKTDHLLGLLAQHGINQVVTTVYSYDVKWDKDPRLAQHPEHEYGGRDDIYPFLGTNTTPDFSALNLTFFQRLDRVVALMHKHGLDAHLMIYVWNKLVAWPPAESAADNRYFDYIIKRYQAYPNVIWDVSKEALNNARCSEPYGVERIERIRRLDAYGRLVTVHDYGFCKRNQETVDFISWQNWSATLYSSTLQAVDDFPDKPVFNIEHGGYERSPYVVFPGGYTDPQVCLRRNYLIQFAGAYSTYYWQGAAWNVLIHNPFDQPPAFDTPRFDYYRHMQRFFTDYPYANFAPSPPNNRTGYCLYDGDRTYLLYVPKENVQVSMYGFKGVGAKHATTRWFNTLTGEYSAPHDHERRFFRSPWGNSADAILIREVHDAQP